MSIVITPADAPATVQQVIMLIYGQPGVGKTTVALTSDEPLLLDFDGGLHRALLRCPRVEVEKWSDVASLNAPDLAPYSTVIIDTFGKAQQMLSQQIMGQDRSAVQRNGELTMQGWGALRRQFMNWVIPLAKMGKDVVILAHSEEFGRGEETVERPMSMGRARNELYQMMDAIGLMSIIAGEIRLNFSPADLSLGKNSGALPAMTVPNPEETPNFLGQAIRQMKDNINSRNAVNVSSRQLRDLSQRLNDINDVSGFQAEMERMKTEESTSQEKRMLINVAKDKGYTLDRQQGIFVLGPEHSATPPAAPPSTTVATPKPAPAAPATAATDAVKSTNGQSTATSEQQFAPPPADPINEPPPPVNDPFTNPDEADDDAFDF